MKTIFTTAFIFISSFLFSQKKYDCIIYARNPTLSDSIPRKERLVGFLSSITDSIIVLSYYGKEISYNWKDVSSVKFRTHNGFCRTVLPISLVFASIIFVGSIVNNSGGSDLSAGFAPVAFVAAIPYSMFYLTPIYFIFRNKHFYINSYHDFMKLKQSSPKYISK